MPSGSFNQAYIRCPYYITDNGRDRITCEGILPGSQNQSFFFHRQDFKQQMQIFCKKDFYRCEICAALDEKHRDD